MLVAAVAAVVGLAVAVLLFRGYGPGGVAYESRGYTVESDALVRVEFEVAKDPAAAAVCSVRAQDRTGAEVGNALVRIGPSPQSRQVVTHDLPTTARAVTGEVTGCSAERAPDRP